MLHLGWVFLFCSCFLSPQTPNPPYNTLMNAVLETTYFNSTLQQPKQSRFTSPGVAISLSLISQPETSALTRRGNVSLNTGFQSMSVSVYIEHYGCCSQITSQDCHVPISCSDRLELMSFVWHKMRRKENVPALASPFLTQNNSDHHPPPKPVA